MSDAAAGPDDKKMTDGEALAASSPDFNWGMMGIGKYLLTPVPGENWRAAFVTFFRTIAGMWILSLLVLFITCLPALNGGTILLDKINGGIEKEREFQLKMFGLQTDLEIKKLDRTMLGEGATKTLEAISRKMDEQGSLLAAQGNAINSQGETINRISEQMTSMTRRQNGLAAQQDRLRQQIDREPARR